MSTFRLLRLSNLLLPISCVMATSCAVYVPTVPGTPLVEKGQVEVWGGIRSVSSLETGVAWSPAPHLLLSAEGAIQYWKDEQTSGESHRQAGLGVGVYTLSKGPKPLYLAAVAGVGVAKADVHEVHIFGPNDRFEAQYRRYYGQFYVSQTGHRFLCGASVRGSWVDYQQVLREGESVGLKSQFYVEPHFFIRCGKGPFQAYATVGMSVPVMHNAQGEGTTNVVLKSSSALAGAGIVFRPHLLQSHKQ